MTDVVNSKAVFIPAIMPTIPFTSITPDVANQIAAVLKKFTDQGVEVWLRFAHEMNYYASSASGVYHGSKTHILSIIDSLQPSR